MALPLDAARECRPAATGASSSSWIRRAIEVASAVGFTPPGPNESSAQTEKTGVEPIDWRSSAADSTAASALTAKRTRSAPRNRCVVVPRSLGAERLGGGASAFRVARADHDFDTRVDEPLRDRPAEAAGSTHDRNSCGGSSTVSASRRDAARSVISVLVAIPPHGELACWSDSSTTSASIVPRSTPRRAPVPCRPPCGRAYGLPAP